MMRILRKWKARKHGVPFELSEFWPSYYGMMQNGWYDARFRVVFDEFSEGNSGKVIPVLEGAGNRHFYTVLRTRHLPGSDWAHVSNVEFFLEYSHTKPTPSPKEAQDMEKGS